MIALASYKIGMISTNSSQITDRLITAGKQTEEFIWEMPYDEIYENELVSLRISEIFLSVLQLIDKV